MEKSWSACQVLAGFSLVLSQLVIGYAWQPGLHLTSCLYHHLQGKIGLAHLLRRLVYQRSPQRHMGRYCVPLLNNLHRVKDPAHLPEVFNTPDPLL